MAKDLVVIVAQAVASVKMVTEDQENQEALAKTQVLREKVVFVKKVVSQIVTAMAVPTRALEDPANLKRNDLEKVASNK